MKQTDINHINEISNYLCYSDNVENYLVNIRKSFILFYINLKNRKIIGIYLYRVKVSNRDNYRFSYTNQESIDIHRFDTLMNYLREMIE